MSSPESPNTSDSPCGRRATGRTRASLKQLTKAAGASGA
jgi:hypothetical protein